MSSLDSRLADWLEGELDPELEAELAADLADDPAALRRLREHEQLARACRVLLANEPASDSTATSILSRIRRERQRRLGLVTGLAMAALLLLGTAWWFWSVPTAATWGHLGEPDPGLIVLRDGQRVPALPSQTVLVGDRLSSPDGVTILHDQLGAELRLQGTATLLPRTAGPRLLIDDGTVDCRVALRPGTRHWSIASPHLETRVLGTVFRLEVGDGRTAVAVTEGRVAVRTTDADAVEQTVSAGQRIIADRRGWETLPAPIPPVTPHPPDPGPLTDPLCWWPCDEGRGRTVADQGRAGLDGNLVSRVQWAPGRQGQALAFVGEGLLKIPDHPAFDIDQGTITLWIKPSRPFAEQTALNPNFPLELVGKSDWNTKRGYELLHPAMAEPGQWGLRINRPDSPSLGAYARLPDRLDWMHLAGSWGDGAIRIYLDGALVAETPDPGGPIPGNDRYATIGNYFHGLIDDVRIYDKALSPRQIAELAEQ